MGWCCSTNPIMDVKVRMITTTCRIYAAGKIHRRQNGPVLELLPFRLQLLTKPISSTFHYLSTIQIPTSFNHCGHSSCFNFSWQCTSWIISIYLICLCLVTEARGDQFSSFNYACEDAQNYYAGAQHLKGEALKKKLHTIIAKHQSLPYKKVWDAIKILDAADFDAPEASPDVVEIYSSRIVSKSLAGKPQGWNREHLWPRSYGLTKGPSLTDLHNIRPADVNVNSSRGNKYYGECSAATSYCLKPATKEAAADTETDKKRWTPPLQVRGDIARALMYMAVCYGFPESDGGVNLQLSDSPNIANKEMGLLSTLLRWNDIDPPSREEKLRNERVCKLYQHNRNPFVDHPEYANLIWGRLSSNSLNFHYWLQKSMD